MKVQSNNGNPKEIDDVLLNNEINIINDAPTTDASDFKKYAKQLSKLIVNKNSIPRFTVGIYGGWGTGKTTMMQMIRYEIRNKYSDDVLPTVWFDAWRYEREEHSAMIPLLRTIILSLNNAIENSKDKNKRNSLRKVERQFRKIGGVIARNTRPNVGINMGSASVGAEFDFAKALDDYKSDGSFLYGQNRNFFS